MITRVFVAGLIILAPLSALAADGLAGFGLGTNQTTHGVASIGLGSTGGGGYQSIGGTTGGAGRFSSGAVNGTTGGQNGDSGHH